MKVRRGMNIVAHDLGGRTLLSTLTKMSLVSITSSSLRPAVAFLFILSKRSLLLGYSIISFFFFFIFFFLSSDRHLFVGKSTTASNFLLTLVTVFVRKMYNLYCNDGQVRQQFACSSCVTNKWLLAVPHPKLSLI